MTLMSEKELAPIYIPSNSLLTVSIFLVSIWLIKYGISFLFKFNYVVEDGHFIFLFAIYTSFSVTCPFSLGLGMFCPYWFV